jgi:succinate dehydrogenase / fumarate reductase cytochrome b subunit
MPKNMGFGYALKMSISAGAATTRDSREAGTLAWLLHRFTGIVIIAYLVLHIHSVTEAAFSERSFDDLLVLYSSPLFLLMDLLLFAAVSFHTLNGIRVMAFDFGYGVKRQRELFYLALALTVVFAVIGLLIMYPTILARW